MSTVEKYFRKAQEYTNINSERLDVIRQCENLLTIRVPLVRDDGSVENITAYRCHHHNHKLPTKGGLMIKEKVDSQLVEALGLVMTIKQSVLDLPHGGAYGAICMDKAKYSSREVEAVVRRYTVEMIKKGFIGGSTDIINPERGCEAQEMNWVKNTAQAIYKEKATQVCTGKSVSQGGIEHRQKANALSSVLTLNNLLANPQVQEAFNLPSQEGQELMGKRIVASRWGTHTYNVVQQLVDRGAILVGAVDAQNNAVYNQDGLCPQELIDYYNQNEKTLPQGQVDPASECDIMVMHDLQSLLTEEKAKEMKCKIVLECSNTPISFEADQHFNARGVLVVPDVLVHSGGAITSYVEWLKSLENVKPGRLTKRWEEISKLNLLNIISQIVKMDNKTLDDYQLDQLRGPSEYEIVESVMTEILSKAIEDTLVTSKQLSISLREACYVNAINRINVHTRIQ